MWQDLLATIPPEATSEAPKSYPSPNISSKKIHEYQDNESDNDSYGSLLTTGTDASQATLDDTALNDPPETYQFSSYAAAVLGSAVSLDSTQISSPTTSTQSEWQKEKQELETQIKKQAEMIEKIQADLEEKISRSQDLEEKLAKAIDLAYTRDVRHEEMMAKFEQLMRKQEEEQRHREYQSSKTDDMHSQPTTPARASKIVASPPTKRANTNSSPNRQVYAVFRPSLGKHSTSKPSFMGTYLKNHRPPASPLRLMETDEEPTPPLPGAKSGQKLE